MIKLNVNPTVLQALKLAYPKASMANNALTKYVATLERHLNQAIVRRNGFQLASQWFSVSLDDLAHEGSRIGKNPQVWVHHWLQDHGLNLVKTHFKAEPKKGVVTKVRLTDLVEVDDYLKAIIDKPESIEDLLTKFDSIGGASFLETYMPNLNKDYENDADLDACYDSFPVDTKSIDYFIDWLLNKSSGFSYAKKKVLLAQALIIKKCSSLLNGRFYQKRKASPFGRTYYEGLSIQGVSKLVRRAVLGDYWQYDANSAVFAYKLSMAKECYEGIKSKNGLTLEETFKHTISLVKDKQSVREMMCKVVFCEDFPLSSDEQIKLIKQAITAIGFGAQLRVKGWILDGAEKSTALNKIFTNIECRQRFVESTFIKELMVEQKLLNDYIYEKTLNLHPRLKAKKEFVNKKGKPIKNKVLAFAYQTGETQVMNAFRAIAAEGNYIPIANIHDAVIYPNKLSDSRFKYIQETIQLHFGSYWCFEPEEIKGFSLDWKERDDLEAEWVAQQQEQHAKLKAQVKARGNGAYQSRWTGSGSSETSEPTVSQLDPGYAYQIGQNRGFVKQGD